jgi:hypothetical protein
MAVVTFFPRQQFNKLRTFAPYTILLLGVALAGLYRQPHGLTTPEAHQLWIVEDAERLTTSGQMFQPRVIIRALWSNTQQMLDRAISDGQPPAYPSLLDFWVLAAGDSLVTIRLLSLFFVLLSTALLSVILRQHLRDYTRGELLALWLTMVAALLPFTITQARSAEPAAMLLLASSLNLWFLLRWMKEPSVPHSLMYALSLTFALYVHFFALVLIAFGGIVQVVRLLQGQRLGSSIDWERLWVRSFTFGIIRWLLSAALGLLLFFPFLLIIEPPVTISDGWQVLWGVAMPWLLVTAGVELMRRLPVQQFSYRVLSVATTGLVILLFTVYLPLTPSVTDWNHAVAMIVQSRQSLEPMVIGYTADSPPAYYAQRTALRGGIALDVGWREFSEAEHQALLQKLDPSQAIWLVMPVDSPAYGIWTAMLEPSRTRIARSLLESISVEQWSAVP